MKSLRNTVNDLHFSENESKHLPEEPRVQLSNNRSNIFRTGKALQNHLMYPYHLLRGVTSFLEKINHTMIDFENIKKSIK